MCPACDAEPVPACRALAGGIARPFSSNTTATKARKAVTRLACARPSAAASPYEPRVWCVDQSPGLIPACAHGEEAAHTLAEAPCQPLVFCSVMF